jgi:hypothetical protein
MKKLPDAVVIKQALSTCTTFVGIVFALNFSRFIEQKAAFLKKTLLYVSAYTYTIYLFHTTFEGFAKAIVLKVPFLANNFNNHWVFIFIVLVVVSAGVLLPIVLHKIVTRYSKIFSFLIGTNFIGKRSTNTK